MVAETIDSKAYAQHLRALIAVHVGRLKAGANITPGLAVVLAGDDPASQVYVRANHRQTIKAGMASFEHRLPALAPTLCSGHSTISKFLRCLSEMVMPSQGSSSSN